MGDKKSSAAHEAADMTRRMVCGGVAGMLAKVSHCPVLDFVLQPQLFSVTLWFR
jgi:hypothetical protein